MEGHRAAGRLAQAPAHPALARSAGIATAFGYAGLVAWAYRDFAMDDAYIGFRYIANLLAGNGFVFSPGAVVEGVTNAGWLLLLAPLAAFAGPFAAAKIAALLFLLATLGLVLVAARRLAFPLAAQWAGFAVLPPTVLLLTLGATDFVAFSMLGMETALLATLLCAAVACVLSGPRPFAWAVLGAIAFLVRPESVLVIPLALAIALQTRATGRGGALRCAALFVCLVGAATAVRWACYGDVLPNTFLAKPSGGFKIVVHMIAYTTGGFANVAAPFTSIFALALAAVGYTALRRAAPLPAAFAAAATATGLLFSLYAGADWTERGRYFAPYAPVALLLLTLGALDAARRLSARTQSARLASAALIATIAVPGMIQTFMLLLPSSRLAYPGYVMMGSTLLEPAAWIRDNLPAEATIATRRVGVLGYTAPQAIFDYTFGLNDRDVAALIQAEGRQFDDPRDPALETLWRARKPDYLLEDANVIDRISGGNRHGFRVHGFEYRAIRAFTIGKNAEWVLAARVSLPSGSP